MTVSLNSENAKFSGITSNTLFLPLPRLILHKTALRMEKFNPALTVLHFRTALKEVTKQNPTNYTCGNLTKTICLDNSKNLLAHYVR